MGRAAAAAIVISACRATPTTPPPPNACAGTCSAIEHLVLIVQENHSFDVYFGGWCSAAPGSNPVCTSGASCCEAMPATEPATSAAPVTLDDQANATFSPDHTQACELAEMNGGKMDKYVTAGCGDRRNFALVAPALVQPYRDLAARYALADRWFQPIAGQTVSNDMYFARAQFVFLDNSFNAPAVGAQCSEIQTKSSFPGPTIGDLLTRAGVTWASYGEGYATMVATPQNACPTAPADCPLGIGTYPCVFDPSDVPFEYYATSRDDPAHMKDFADFEKAAAQGTLPAVSYVKPLGYHTEHPALGTRISDGVAFVMRVVNDVLASPQAGSTLLLFTYDESGGYYDHVAPPPPSDVDLRPYGPRVPTMAIGRFARKGSVSHVVMEHSSIVKFIEWNWLGGRTGQLGGRDLEVHNIGGLLDPAETGVAVPQD
jgi:phospholipase C